MQNISCLSFTGSHDGIPRASALDVCARVFRSVFSHVVRTFSCEDNAMQHTKRILRIGTKRMQTMAYGNGIIWQQETKMRLPVRCCARVGCDMPIRVSLAKSELESFEGILGKISPGRWGAKRHARLLFRFDCRVDSGLRLSACRYPIDSRPRPRTREDSCLLIIKPR